MSTDTTLIEAPLFNLNRAFLLNHPRTAARKLENISPAEAVEILQHQQPQLIGLVLEKIAPSIATLIFLQLPESLASRVLTSIDTGVSVSILNRITQEKIESYLSLLNDVNANELRSLLEYPDNTVGRLMNPQIFAFNKNTSVKQVISQLKKQNLESLHHLFVLNDDMKLNGEVEIRKLILADENQSIGSLASPIVAYLNALDPKEEVMTTLDKFRVDSLPVVDIDFKLVGIVEGQDLMDAMREEIVTGMQTMVGASKDERALSSSFFAVQKRLPWLQVNLLTAFLAAAVVGLFEDTIAQFTALAILLPIAAGQSGNTGAQALAVTMRGLTLREISLKHWHRVMLKEFGAGFLNGLGIALTCSAGVYVWSQSLGLALVMALAMIISMTIAGIAGALVPMILKRFGLDPAQSSSIVLTTITDVAGFMSFLGIATLLSGMLVTS